MIKVSEKQNYQSKIDKIVLEEKQKGNILWEFYLESNTDDTEYYCIYRLPTSKEFKDIRKQAAELKKAGNDIESEFDYDMILKNCCVFPDFEHMKKFEDKNLGTFDKLITEIINKTNINANVRSKKL